MSKREDIFEKLDNLIEQNQFELVSDKVDDNRLKVIYLMNDAVESFIVFENARITGEYIKDYQGEINTSLTVQKNDSTGNDEYVLVVHQKDSVCTVFFLEDVENKIFNMEKKEISSRVIGEIVMERLKELDQVAYVRFASVYREFKDVNTFMDELKKLLK